MDNCYSRGNINAPLMFIGENPGREECGHSITDYDNLGREKKLRMPIPFCGKAGRALHRMISWAEIMEGEYILSNVYKKICFKGNRVTVANEDQLLAVRDESILEIKKIDPKLIITLGTGPVWLLCYYNKVSRDDIRMGKLNGVLQTLELEWFDKSIRKYTILPLYHPSAVIRDESGERGYKVAVSNALIQHKELICKATGRVML